MLRHRWRNAGLALLLVSLLLGLSACAMPAADPPKPGPVRLVVLVVFDQMRGDYLTRWDGLFTEDGFHRLEKEGAWFQNCHYAYAGTVTGAGHASLGTGASPAKHGIVFNDWFDRTEGDFVYCASSPRYQRVPPPEKKDPEEDKGKAKKSRDEPGAPVRLLLPTLGEAFKDATEGKGRVVSLSMKDRGAVLPAGRKPDACYWFDTSGGLFVTSTFYRDRVHPWVEEYNAARPADRLFGKDWERLRADLDYEKYSGPDDQVGEAKGLDRGRTFPHAMTGGLKKPGKAFYEAVYTSPMGNDVLLGLVKRAIDAEKLGTRDTPDLLLVSFSCNDPVGHYYGPDSQEVLDVTLRADLVVKELLRHLDDRVGKGRYLLALTADHGVCPMPEVSRAQGKDVQRLIPEFVYGQAEEFLQQSFNKKGMADVHFLAAFMNHGSFYFDGKGLKAAGVEPGRAEEALAGWLKEQPWVQTAYTRTELMREPARDDAIGQMVKRSFHPDRSGDVILIPKPYNLVWTYLTGAGHGTPHPYDTHVPLLVYGPGVRPGVRRERILPQACTAILAHGLRVKPPAGAEATVPEQLFGD
jgi:hypothetical protein